MRQRILKLTVSILIAFSFLFGIGAYEILHLSQNAQSLALHNTTSAYDRSMLQNNPASLSLEANKTVFSSLIFPAGIHSGEIQKIHIMGSGIHAGKLSYINYGTIVDSETGEETTAYDILLEMGYKKELKNIVSVGISGGYLLSSISGYKSQLLYTKIGLRSRMKRKRMGLGFSLENIGFHISSYTEVREPIPVVFRSSLYYRPKFVPAIINVDIIYRLNADALEFSSGVELNPMKRLIFRIGCSTHRTEFITNDLLNNLLADISGGVGFQFNKINLDVGFMNLGAAGYVVGFSISRHID